MQDFNKEYAIELTNQLNADDDWSYVPEYSNITGRSRIAVYDEDAKFLGYF